MATDNNHPLNKIKPNYYMPRAKKVVYEKDKKCLFIPENVDLTTLLDKQEMKHADKYHYFIHQLYLRRVTDTRITKNTFISVNYDTLEDILTTRHTNKIVKFWIDNNIVERTNQYIVGSKSYGYRLTEEYREVRNKKITINDKKFADKLERKRRERNSKLDLSVPHHAFINYNLEEINIDSKPALATAFSVNSTKKGTQHKKEKSFNKWVTSIHAIENKEWFISRDKTGKRIHYNFSNLASKLRKHIYLNTGEVIVNIDIRCSQPLMLAILLKKHYKGSAMPANVFKYISECEAGSLYESFSDAAGLASIDDRKKFKRNFFKKVLYGTNEKATLTKEWYVFASLFPDVAAYIVESKRSNYKLLSHSLQRQESEIIIDGVFAGLALDYFPEQYFALPIHDSITVTKSNVEDIKMRILNEFKKYGVAPTLTEETFN